MFKVLPWEDTKVGLSHNLLVQDSTSRQFRKFSLLRAEYLVENSPVVFRMHGILPDGADHAATTLFLKDKNPSHMTLEWIGNTKGLYFLCQTVLSLPKIITDITSGSSKSLPTTASARMYQRLIFWSPTQGGVAVKQPLLQELPQGSSKWKVVLMMMSQEWHNLWRNSPATTATSRVPPGDAARHQAWSWKKGVVPSQNCSSLVELGSTRRRMGAEWKFMMINLNFWQQKV